MSAYAPYMFDYRPLAKTCGISEEQLEVLRVAAFREFPGDALMGELHVLRMLMTLQEGVVRLEDLLAEIRACSATEA